MGLGARRGAGAKESLEIICTEAEKTVVHSYDLLGFPYTRSSLSIDCSKCKEKHKSFFLFGSCTIFIRS